MKFSRKLILATFMFTGAAQVLAGEPIPGVDVDLGKQGGGTVMDGNSAMGQVSTTRGRVGKPPVDPAGPAANRRVPNYELPSKQSGVAAEVGKPPAGPAGISDQGATGGLISYTTAPRPADPVLPASAQVGGFGNGISAGPGMRAGPGMGAGPAMGPSPIAGPSPSMGAGAAMSPGMGPGAAMGAGGAMRGR